MNYRECFLRDFKLCQHYMRDPDFAEGVRTVLVEKGATPEWTHKHILDVSQEEIRRRFEFPSSFKDLDI